MPLTSDVEAAVSLAAESINESSRRARPAQDPIERLERSANFLRSGAAEGRLYRVAGRPVGVSIWDATHPGVLHLEILYLQPRSGTPESYGTFLDGIEREVRPIAMLPAGLVGLTAGSEEALLRGRGFLPFARSEMRFPPGATPPVPRSPPGIRVRSMRPEDESAVAALHAAAFGPGFDFYLFQVDPDPVKDSQLAVRDMLSGRYGEFLPWASFLAETESGTAVGASVFVRAPYGPLLVSVHVDPAAQGQRIGEALVVASVRALRGRGESVIALNVTEGNRRAVTLYERLGFVRSIGPEWSWFSRARVPVAPDGSATRPKPGPGRPDVAGRVSGAP